MSKKQKKISRRLSAQKVIEKKLKLPKTVKLGKTKARLIQNKSIQIKAKLIGWKGVIRYDDWKKIPVKYKSQYVAEKHMKMWMKQIKGYYDKDIDWIKRFKEKDGKFFINGKQVSKRTYLRQRYKTRIKSATVEYSIRKNLPLKSAKKAIEKLIKTKGVAYVFRIYAGTPK